MKFEIKVVLVNIIIYMTSYFIIKFVLSHFFNINDYLFAMIPAVIITGVLAPKTKTIQTQNGVKKQMKWIFQKKVKTYYDNK